MGFGSQYVGNPIGVQAPDTAPAIGKAPSIYLPSDLDGASWAQLSQAFKDLCDNLTLLHLNAVGAGYGDGSDGNITLGAGTTTLTRDMFYNNLTLGATSILVTAGYRVYVANILTIASGGFISANGTDSTLGVQAFGINSNSVGGSGNGGAPIGTNSTNGAVGQSLTISLGGAGGSGTGAGAFTGGTGGTVTAPPPGFGGVRVTATLQSGILLGTTGVNALLGGGGGGSGACGTNHPSGGGGGGGGVLLVAARNCVLAGVCLQANGGAGGPAVAGATAGTGGGGGGGVVLFTYRTINGTASSFCSANGGAGTNVNGFGGVTSAAGSPGTVIAVSL